MLVNPQTVSLDSDILTQFVHSLYHQKLLEGLHLTESIIIKPRFSPMCCHGTSLIMKAHHHQIEAHLIFSNWFQLLSAPVWLLTVPHIPSLIFLIIDNLPSSLLLSFTNFQHLFSKLVYFCTCSSLCLIFILCTCLLVYLLVYFCTCLFTCVPACLCTCMFTCVPA